VTTAVLPERSIFIATVKIIPLALHGPLLVP